MEPLSTEELAAMRAWMETERLTLRRVAELTGVSNPSVHAWLQGGSLRQGPRSALLKLITPYLKPSDHFVGSDKMVPAEIRPSLRSIYAKLCELEDAGDTAADAAPTTCIFTAVRTQGRSWYGSSGTRRLVGSPPT